MMKNSEIYVVADRYSKLLFSHIPVKPSLDTTHKTAHCTKMYYNPLFTPQWTILALIQQKKTSSVIFCY